MSRMETKVFKIGDIETDSGQISQAVSIIKSGGLVGFATETVYGIGCVVRPGMLEKLDALKGRGAEKRYSLHIASPGDLGKYVLNIGARGRKLVEAFWPGPLTIVFEPDDESMDFVRGMLAAGVVEALYIGGTIGVRCPDNELCKALLGKVDEAVVASSANLSGERPATAAEQVIKDFDGKIEAVVDGDPRYGCKYNQSSTVVKVSSGKIEVLREGMISKEQIEEKSSINICFVCTGNTCRSPMAEYFCKKLISEKLDCDIDELPLLGYKVTSAGTMNAWQGPASAEVIEICGNIGVDATGHLSKSLQRYEVDSSDYIFVMTDGHLGQVLQMWPWAKEKCFKLDGEADVGDPFGADMGVYQACAGQIEQAIKKRIGEILK